MIFCPRTSRISSSSWVHLPTASSSRQLEALFHFEGGRAFDVAAETFAHGGEDLLGKGVFLARTETGVERNRKDFGGYSFLERGRDRPTPFARIFDEARVTSELAITRQCGRSQIEQPR